VFQDERARHLIKRENRMFTQRIRILFKNIRYAWHERRTPYIDNEALKKRYLESREVYHEKMDSTYKHLKNGDSTQFQNELLIALEYLDISSLWEKKTRLAKNINDIRDNVPLTLIGTIVGYLTSLGSAIAMISMIYMKGSNAPYDPFFWGFLIGSLFFGITGGYNQERLRRLVEEHKDYTREFKETTYMIERKK
jgi:hypothetical protein